jgi:hypothetical protein
MDRHAPAPLEAEPYRQTPLARESLIGLQRHAIEPAVQECGDAARTPVRRHREPGQRLEVLRWQAPAGSGHESSLLRVNENERACSARDQPLEGLGQRVEHRLECDALGEEFKDYPLRIEQTDGAIEIGQVAPTGAAHRCGPLQDANQDRTERSAEEDDEKICAHLALI